MTRTMRRTRTTRGWDARAGRDQDGTTRDKMGPRGWDAAVRRALPPVLMALAMAAAMAVGGGCHRAAYEEPEHHVPAHRPADYPAAVARLEALHRQFLGGESASNAIGNAPGNAAGNTTENMTENTTENAAGNAAGNAGIVNVIDPFDEFHDLARWLPELAGDSDLVEAEWVRVNRQARLLVDAFAPVRAAALADRRRSYDSRREMFASGLRELRAVADAFPRNNLREERE